MHAARLIASVLVASTLTACGGLPDRDAADVDAASVDNLVLDAPFEHPDSTIDAAGDPRLHVIVRDTIRGEGLPCKLTIRGVNGTASPNWGSAPEQIGEWLDPSQGALGIGRWVLMARGRASIGLPPGRYALTVSRGPEYARLELGEVVITAAQGAIVTGDLRRVIESEGEIAGEFHVHSAPSFDSDVPLDQRVLSLAAEGVEVFASTDHDALGDFRPAIAALGLARFIHWIPGDEITADGIGHFGVYPLPEGLDPTTALTHDEPTVSQIIARARGVAPAAAVQLNHPMWNERIGYWRFAGFDPATGMGRMELFSAFDAIEVWNGHTLDQGDFEYVDPDRVIDMWMTTLQIARGVTAMGNSDTHRLSHSPPGWPRTYLRVPTDDPAMVQGSMIADAIRAGDAMLSSGPFLRATIGAVRPGGVVRMSGGNITVHVELQWAEWTPASRIEVVANRRVVAMRDVTSRPAMGFARESWDIPVTLTRDAWIVVRTRSEGGLPDAAGEPRRSMPSLALVNPIYVDVDGDGAYRPPGIGVGP